MQQRSALLVPSFVLAATLGAQVSQPAQPRDARIHLHYGLLDPAVGRADVPALLQAPAGNELYLVQSRTRVDQAFRDAIRGAGAQLHQYFEPDAYLVRMNAAARGVLEEHALVRGIAPFHVAYKLEPRLAAELLGQAPIARRQYLLVMVDPATDTPVLAAAIAAAGGRLTVKPDGNILLEAELTAAQALALAAHNTVQWVQISTPIEFDMDNARIQGGANHIETLGGYTGKGVRGHIMEGVYPTHTEFIANAYRTIPQSVFSAGSDTHGNATFGCVFARGAAAQARGLCPDGQGFYTPSGYVSGAAAGSQAQNSRYGVVREITDPTKPYQCMFQTASWGYSQITAYDARSAEMDNIIFTFDIPITQSQSNTGNRTSRPQAWAKNIISIGGVSHFDNANPADDRWTSASYGPASDNRQKPELCAYYEQIYTTYSATGYGQFGGTSGATPICAGHVGLCVELFTEGLFGYPKAPTWQNRFPYRAHFSTTKALLINSARPYPLTQVTRDKQGWGFPSLQDLHDARDRSLVVDELDVLAQGERRTHYVFVAPGAAAFRSTMVYSDRQGPTNVTTPHRINDLNLLVADLAGTTVYHGNNGLTTANVSLPGGTPDGLNTVENVFVQSPAAGVWRVEVSAPLVAMDTHVETGAIDADFALVVSGIGGGRNRSGATLDFTSTGAGNLQLAAGSRPATWTEGITFVSAASTRPYGNGNLFGLEVDALTLGLIQPAAAAGNPFRFTNTSNPALFPNAPFVFPPALALALQGLTFDAVTMYLDGANVVAVTNVSRVTVQ